MAVLVGYTAVSFAYFGWRLLPHPGRVLRGLGFDPQTFVWSFGWWAHAIASWTNPFVSHAVYAPTGVNLAWTPSASGLAVVFAPLTWLFGPAVSYNVAELLLPALAAWTAYLLCRHLTGSIWASIIGGYLFGFSGYILGEQLPGHPNLSGVFLIPLVALVVVRYVEAELKGRGLAWRLGALVAGQLWISSEIVFTLTLMLAIGLVLAFSLLPGTRARLRSAVVPIVKGYVIGGVLAAPLLVFTVIGFVPGSVWSGGTLVNTGTSRVGVDLINFALPTQTYGAGDLWSVAPDLGGGGPDGYLGVPTLLIIGVFAYRARGTSRGRFLLSGFFVSAVLAFGAALFVDGHRLFALPWWKAATHLPLFDDVFPFRLAVYVSLAAAVTVAVWIGTTKGRVYARPYVLPVLAVAALVPAVWGSSDLRFNPQHPARVAFFTDGLYKTCIPQDETLAVFPFGGNSLLWQAETGFWFNLAAGGLQPVTKNGKPLTSFAADTVVQDLTFSDDGLPTMDRLLEFVANHHIDRVISIPSGGYPNRAQMASFGRTQLIGGALVSPACGDKPLSDRNLSSFVREYQQQKASRPNIGYCLGGNFDLLPQGLSPSGVLAGARRAIFVSGKGLTCASPPAGYKRAGFATGAMNVPPHTYPLYAP